MSVVVRFAPSPTGALHIGSVRTALFNWLFARHCGGKFLLRIEDTDKLRSTEENIASILRILKWLHIDWDDEPVVQSKRINRHVEVVNEMISRGVAYRCFCSPEELSRKKEEAIEAAKPYQYDRSCRDLEKKPAGEKFVVRLRAEILGKTEIHDMVQGKISVDNSQVDDFVLLRSDGTPTYMLSVVVDDHDMNITHVIRGDDHLTNTFRQMQIYRACGWTVPEFGHIPLIYGPDGTKLSKRHGAASAEDYMAMGYLPETILNYLLRLGWSHGDDEIISKDEAVLWFGFDSVGKSPARFDVLKLENLNAHYIREKNNEELLVLIEPLIETKLDDVCRERIKLGLSGLKKRSKTLKDLAEAAMIYVSGPASFSAECTKYATLQHLTWLEMVLEILKDPSKQSDSIDEMDFCEKVKILAQENGTKLVEIAQALRGALCGKLVSPSVFEIMSVVGKMESIARIRNFITFYQK